MRRLLLSSLCWIIPLLLITACAEHKHNVRFHLLNYQDIDTRAIQDIFQQQASIQLEISHSQPGQSALEALQAGDVDLALVNNSTPFTEGIRAIMPVHKSLLHLLVREDLGTGEETRSLRNKIIYIANNSLAGRKLVELLAERQQLSPDDYTLVDVPKSGETDLILYFGPINPINAIWQGKGYRLVNLANAEDNEFTLSRTSLSYLLPGMEIMDIPARTYPIPGNETKVKTIGVDTLLVTRRDLSINLVYLLSQTLFEQKPRFRAVAPSLFSGINASFDPMQLNFPLHPGARRYLARDEPGFLERYAETINMLVYVAFLIITGFLGLARWRAHRKKDRIDTFYTRALEIREQATRENSPALKQQLLKLEQEAFQSLIAEKLAANESFRIFTDLMTRIHTDLDKLAERMPP